MAVCFKGKEQQQFTYIITKNNNVISKTRDEVFHTENAKSTVYTNRANWKAEN